MAGECNYVIIDEQRTLFEVIPMSGGIFLQILSKHDLIDGPKSLQEGF
jgi:hypothetical protein